MREPRPDWVYNNLSYTSVSETLAGGETNSLAIQLVNSENVMRALQFGQVEFLNLASANSVSSEVVGSWERPEGKRTLVHAFQGVMFGVPSTWTTGSTIQVGARLLVAEQNALVGNAVLQPFYSMWVASPATGSGLGRWANEKRCIAEWRWSRSFDSSIASPIMEKHFFHRMKWRLRPEEGLFLYLEQPTGAATLRITTYFRSLVSGQK